MAKPRDPLSYTQPHTPREGQLPDSVRPTCSQPSANNKGCDQYANCRFLSMKQQNAGPFMLIVEDHRDVKQGEGRRVDVWCFHAARMYFGANPKQGYSVVEDRVYAAAESTEIAPAVIAPDGRVLKPPVLKPGFTAKQLAPYEKQGPFYYPPDSAAPEGMLEAIKGFKPAKEPATSGAR